MEAVMYNYTAWVSGSFIGLADDMTNMLEHSGFTILSHIDHHFTPYGYTGLWLLSESHLAIHTFPEHNVFYIELSSCVKEYYDNMVIKITERFGIENITRR